MMRLIDADKLKKELIDAIDWLREKDYETYSAVGDDIVFVLDKQLTAYDVDKVVEQSEIAKAEKMERASDIERFFQCFTCCNLETCDLDEKAEDKRGMCTKHRPM